MFNLFKRKDPVCGMKEEKGKGFLKGDHWFCSKDCMKKYGEQAKSSSKRSCCH